MARAIFQTNGELGAWLEQGEVNIVDPPSSLWDYDPDAFNADGIESHPLREVTDFIATHIAALPIKLYRRLPDGSRERVRGHPLADLLHDPTGNPAIPAYAFWLSLIMDGLLADRFLALPITKQDGTVHLKRIPPRRWSVVHDDFDEITGIRLQVQGHTEKLKIHETSMLLSVGYAFTGAGGMPKRKRLKAILDEYKASIEFRKAVNERGLQAPLVIERDRPWPSETSADRFRASMRAFVHGGAAAGGGMVLEDGMKATQLDAFKPIDVADLDARDKVKVDVANAYGIPPELVGIREGNFSNLAAFKQMLYGTYLDPYITSFEQALNMCLLPMMASYHKALYIEVDRDGQLRGDPVQQYSALSTATGRPFLTTNEARELLNRPNLPEGDGLVTPLNVLIGGQTSPQDGQTESRGTPTDEPPDIQDDDERSTP
ncbi:phage portal protein [Bifidobacterium cuniculi]|uniref:Phage portal protein n=1 Tax=Bifidobacterium cuniculi TaxID=1688 RepID=A0A087B4F1_9BIFI|nr:phage portal protein [Bifidobacterium cuniculi]KFI65901.1 phage portal protein [Bifidobacterium cuniculi]